VQRMGRKVRVVMEITEQRNRESAHALRPARQKKIMAHNARTVRLKQNGISGKGDCAGSSGQAKKSAS